MLKLWRAGLLGCLIIAGCAPAPTTAPPTPARLTPVEASPSPEAPVPSPTPATVATTLTLWLPPQFAPVDAQAGGAVLSDQLAAYALAHPGWSVQARPKAAAGPGSLLESLLSAYNAAPAALPDVVALPRADLEAAAAAGVLLPLESWVPAEVLQAAYPVAQALGRVEGQWVGAPFAVDARILVYSTDLYATPPARWDAVITGTLVLPGAEPAGLTVLTDYLAGGALTDSTGAIQLDAARLAASLASWRALEQAQILPLSTLTYADPAAAWQVFRERRAELALTTFSQYLREAQRVSRAGAALPPTTAGQPFTLAEGWCWALTNKTGDRAAAADLLNWLIAPARQAAWTQAAQMLPAQPAALAGWEASPFEPLAAEVLRHAQLQPSATILQQAGPVLRLALEEVLNGRATPEAAALAAAQALSNQPP